MLAEEFEKKKKFLCRRKHWKCITFSVPIQKEVTRLGKIETLLLADVFENFQNMCLEMYEFDPVRFLTAPGLARQTALKGLK